MSTPTLVPSVLAEKKTSPSQQHRSGRDIWKRSCNAMPLLGSFRGRTCCSTTRLLDDTRLALRRCELVTPVCLVHQSAWHFADSLGCRRDAVASQAGAARVVVSMLSKTTHGAHCPLSYCSSAMVDLAAERCGTRDIQSVGSDEVTHASGQHDGIPSEHSGLCEGMTERNGRERLSALIAADRHSSIVNIRSLSLVR